MEISILFMLLGFLFAAYAVIANDSVQTLGTFIESNRKIKWVYQWGFISSILVATLLFSWWMYQGDITQGRLDKIPFVEIQWYHSLAPLVLVILTRFGIPVSTSLLVLSAFASGLVFEKILVKSAIGYVLAGCLAYALWIILTYWEKKAQVLKGAKEVYWRWIQWAVTGFLWYSWLSHDVANIAVFLPRNLSFLDLLGVLIIFVAGLAFIFRERGGRIQKIVQAKTNTSYVRSATMIDLLFAFILIYLKQVNNIPMSTTWVFIGLLSGRELAIATIIRGHKIKTVFPLIGKDLVKLLFGLFISVVIALLIQNVEFISTFF